MAKTKTKEKEIPQAEFETIKAFAAGDSSLRAKAIEIHRKHLKSSDLHNTPAMRFMSEIDHPCPDLMLRNQYRKALLA